MLKKAAVISFAFFLLSTGFASAKLIENGDFETLSHIQGKVGSKTYLDELTVGQWNVYDTLPPELGGWYAGSGDSGIEIQYSTVAKVNPDGTKREDGFYNHYVELDSHGGSDTNSSMYQNFEVTVEQEYILSFYYRSRTSVAATNGIEVTLEPEIGWINPFLTINTTSDDEYTSTTWQLYSFNLGMLSAGDYTLGFTAVGTDDTYGGFIDNVAINPVPEPATMLLFGTGIAGLAGVSRRKKK